MFLFEHGYLSWYISPFVKLDLLIIDWVIDFCPSGGQCTFGYYPLYQVVDRFSCDHNFTLIFKLQTSK